MTRPVYRTLSGIGAAGLGLLHGCGGSGASTKDAEPAAALANAVRDIRQETFSKGVDVYPAVAPGGAEFAYQRLQNGNYDIWAKPTRSQSDSAGRQVTFHTADDRRPAWLGDEVIVFDSWRVDGNKLWKQRSSGSGGTTLLSRGNNIDMDADVSADGSVVFVSQVTQDEVVKDTEGRLWIVFQEMPAIWRLDPDGSMTILAQGVSPSWSPDGKRIAFASNKEGNFDIYTMDADGSNQSQLDTNKADDVDPCWSPDGRYIAFASDRSDGRGKKDFNIWAMRAEGGGLTQLTDQQGYDGGPAWGKPDEKYPEGRIYYHSYLNRDWDIWSIAPRLD